jgi:hypothetical protein
MRDSIVLATAVPLLFCCALAHAYSEEEVNRVEVPPEDAVVQMRTDGQTAGLVKPQASANNDVAPASLIKTPEQVSTKIPSTTP